MTIDRAIDRADRANRNASVMRASDFKPASRPHGNGSGGYSRPKLPSVSANN
jgi:hypothetical protein